MLLVLVLLFRLSDLSSSHYLYLLQRSLILRLHPDKNPPELSEEAEAGFREVVAAYEILSNPDKRAAFDDFGGDGGTEEGGNDGGFDTFWEYQQSGKKDERNFYTGHPLITQLTEKLWDRRLVGNVIWLVTKSTLIN